MNYVRQAVECITTSSPPDAQLGILRVGASIGSPIGESYNIQLWRDPDGFSGWVYFSSIACAYIDETGSRDDIQETHPWHAHASNSPTRNPGSTQRELY